MYRFVTNPPSRQVRPRPMLLPGATLVADAGGASPHDTPLAMIEAHIARTGIAPSTLSRQITGDSRLVTALRAGRQPHPSMAARIAAICTGEARHG